MATEHGTITRANNGRAWVKTKKSQACESCATKHACNMMGGDNDMEVEVLNPIRAGVGDLVVIQFATGSLLKATFLLYVFPIFCLIIGAFLGDAAASGFQLNPSAISAVFGFLGLGLSLIYVRSKGNRMASQKEYQPEITRIIQKSGVPGGDETSDCQASDGIGKPL